MAGGRTIERMRLIGPLSKARVVVLQAPGGFGKSTLADQLLDRWELVSIRVRLRAPTGEAELVDALRRALRRAGLNDLAVSITDTEPAGAIDQLVGSAHARNEQFSLLVDDIHLLSLEGWRLLDALVADLPAGCHSVVCARTLPGEVVAVRNYDLADADDLRMTTAEVSDLLGEMSSPSLASDVSTITGGWPMAVVVAATRLRTEPTWSPSARSSGVTLLAGLLEPLVGDDAPAFARLARLPMLDATVAELVGGPGALDRLASSAVPSRTEHGHWTVIPDPIRDALIAIGGGSGGLDPAMTASVAEHYAERGELPSATQLVRDSRDLDALARLLARRHWTELEALGFEQLTQLIGLIPEPILGAHAMLLVGVARASEQSRPSLRRKCVDLLQRLPALAPSVRLAADAERSRTLVLTARPDEAIALAEAVVACSDRSAPGDALSCGRALVTIGQAQAFVATESSYDRAEQALTEAATIFHAAGEYRWEAEALARLGYNVLFHRGRIADGAQRLERALALLPTGDRTRANWLTWYADVLTWTGEQAAADAAITEATEIGERLRDPGIVALTQWTLAWMLGRRGDVAGVCVALSAVERLRPGWLDGVAGVEFYASLCDFFVSLDDVESCRYCERKAHELGDRYGYPQVVDFMSARIEAHIGEPALALDMLDRLEGSIGEAPNSRWIRRLEAALAAFRLGDEDRARNMIVAAKAMVDAMGLPDLPRRLEGPMVTRLAAMWPGSPSTEPARITSVTMFGTFAVRAGDQDVTPPAGHPSTLLKLLVLQRTMTVDAAIDSLWPDADAERGRARLRNTMNRLRTRSGPCIERRGDVLELTDTVRTDVEVFDRAATAALTADASTRIGLARQAISLYAGELLPGDVFEDWAAAPRERMLRRYVGLIDLVADAAEREGDHDEAARLLDLGVAADPLEERRYVRLAQVLTTQGRVTAARRVAEQGIAVFAEIGLSPSPELARLGS